MLIKDLLNDTVPPLKTTDTVGRALRWMNALRCSELPVLGLSGYVGMLKEEDLIREENHSLPLSDLTTPFLRGYVNEYQHIFDAIKFCSAHGFAVVPVLDEPGRYLGLVTTTDLINAIAEANSLQDPGGVVVLEVDNSRFSLAEIARIVESEGARILSASANASDEAGKTEVTLKIDRVDLTRIMAGFFRNDMEVKASYHQSEFQPDLQARYDAFMNYLKM